MGEVASGVKTFVSCGEPLAGYDVREIISYRRWLVPGTGQVLVLERGPSGHEP